MKNILILLFLAFCFVGYGQIIDFPDANFKNALVNTKCVDTDGDGMPDEWEKANGLNPNDPSDANKDCTGDGYTNIEKYINGISTTNCIDWSDLKNNFDTLAAKGKLM